MEAVTAAINWDRIITNLGAFGLVAWIVMHLFSKHIPAITDAFTKTLDTLAKTFNENMAESRTLYQAEQRESREKQDETVSRVLDMCRAEFSDIRKDNMTAMSEIRRDEKEKFTQLVNNMCKARGNEKT